MTSNKPYIVRAFYQWITDNQLTPYVVVDVNVYGVLVPMSYVNDGQIILNVSSSAVGTIALGNDSIEFSARFGGKLEHIYIPYGAIAAIYAKENGAGTSLAIEHPPEQNDVEPSLSLSSVSSSAKTDDTLVSQEKKTTKKKGRASLKVIK
ncbi:MAG: ClpXP protease specificity-enhancing factor [Colwellia sp.]|nr:ClpXP protease specificity-enhancing factor [Colwellia sp.]